MQYHYFEGRISAEEINKLTNTLSSMNGKIELWFTTMGGEASVMKYLISFLNYRKDDIEIVLTSKIYSAGTFLLLDFKGKIRIEDLDSVLFHVADREIFSYRKDEYSVNHKILAEQDLQYNKLVAEKIKNKGLLSDKQLKQFLNGKNVVIYKSQFDKWKL